MALFKTIEHLAEVIPVLESSAFQTFLPALEAAEDQFLSRGALGVNMYNQLHAAYQTQDEAITTPALAALLPYARKVSAHMAMDGIIPLLDVQVASGGLMVNSTPNMAPAARWRVDNLKRQHRKLGYNALDRLVTKMAEEYMSYPGYGDTFSLGLSTGFVRTADEFSAVVNINKSAYLYLQLRPTILEVQNTLVRQIVYDKTLFDTLLEYIRTGTNIPPDNVKYPIMAACRQVIVHEALARQGVELSLAKNEDGITTFSSTMNGEGIGGPVPASDSRVEALVKYHAARSAEYQTALIDALRAAAESGDPDHAAYLASAAYTQGNTTSYNTDTDLSTYGGF